MDSLADPQVPLLTARVRTDLGWRPTDESGEPVAVMCPVTDHHGGELCRIGDGDWWAGVGARDCGSQVPECVGSSTIQTATAEIPGKAVG